MSNHSESAPSSRYIKVAAIAFAIAFGLHGADHLLRGMAASPMPVMVGGLIQGIFVVIAVALILRERPLARPVAISVGFGSAALFVYAHLLPTFVAGYQDSFVSGPRIGYAGLRSPRASLAIRRTA